MTDRKIQQIWQNSYEAFLSSGYFLSDAQKKASYAIMNCKTGSLGMNISLCPDCGHMKFHNNSCRKRCKSGRHLWKRQPENTKGSWLCRKPGIFLSAG